MSGYTPGPWVAAIDDPEDCAIYTTNEEFVANVGADRIACISPKNGKHVIAFDMTVADAHLIAAAPDLLAAARMAFEDLEEYEWTGLPGDYAVTATVRQLRTAIAKAEGIKEEMKDVRHVR